MASKKQYQIEEVFQNESNIFSAIPVSEDHIYFSSENGYVMLNDGQTIETQFPVEASPRGLAYDPEGNKIYIADKGSQKIFLKDLEDTPLNINQLARDFDLTPFIGPHDLALSEDGSKTQFNPRFFVYKR